MDILKISNLSKIISNKLILDDISFSVHEGEIFGFLGPNGAGKTTTIKIITGLMKPSSGEILINNTNIEKEPLKAISNIGAIVENPSLYKYLTGLENLKLVAKLRHVNINERDSDVKIYKKYIEENICTKQIELIHLNEVLNKLNTIQ